MGCCHVASKDQYCNLPVIPLSSTFKYLLWVDPTISFGQHPLYISPSYMILGNTKTSLLGSGHGKPNTISWFLPDDCAPALLFSFRWRFPFNFSFSLVLHCLMRLSHEPLEDFLYARHPAVYQLTHLNSGFRQLLALFLSLSFSLCARRIDSSLTPAYRHSNSTQRGDKSFH